MDTLVVALLYRGVLYVEVILYSKECNWYTRCCPLNGGVRYRECPLREANLHKELSAANDDSLSYNEVRGTYPIFNLVLR